MPQRGWCYGEKKYPEVTFSHCTNSSKTLIGEIYWKSQWKPIDLFPKVRAWRLDLEGQIEYIQHEAPLKDCMESHKMYKYIR